MNKKVLQNAKTPPLISPNHWSRAYAASRLPPFQAATAGRPATMAFVLSPVERSPETTLHNFVQRIVWQILNADLKSASKNTSSRIGFISKGHFDLGSFPCKLADALQGVLQGGSSPGCWIVYPETDQSAAGDRCIRPNGMRCQ